MKHLLLALPILCILYIIYELYIRNYKPQTEEPQEDIDLAVKKGVYTGLSSIDDLATQISKIKKNSQYPELEQVFSYFNITRIEQLKNLNLPELNSVDKDSEYFKINYRDNTGIKDYPLKGYMTLALLNNAKKIFIRISDFYPQTAGLEPLRCINSPLYLITTCMEVDQDNKMFNS